MNARSTIKSFRWTGLFAALFGTAVHAFEPLPAKPADPAGNPATPAKTALGKALYFDPRLSVDGTVSCNSCDNVMAGGEDNRPVSVGVRPASRNRPKDL